MPDPCCLQGACYQHRPILENSPILRASNTCPATDLSSPRADSRAGLKGKLRLTGPGLLSALKAGIGWGPGLGRLYFEYLHFRYRDPYGLESKPYVKETYERQLGALAGQRFRRGLELGCSVGTLTDRLALHCDSLLAIDISYGAVRRARQRLKHRPGVRVERRFLPDGLPAGPFDLIVCSEVLFFWSPETLLAALPRIEAALAPGGVLLANHWRGDNPDRPQQADDVHDLLGKRLRLRHVATTTQPEYRLDHFEKSA